MNRQRGPICLLLILCLLCSLAAGVLLVRRIRTETANKMVCPVISCEDAVYLAEASGKPAEEWLAALRGAGLQGVLMTPEQAGDPALSRLAAESGLTPIQAGGLARGGIYFFALCYDETRDETWANRIISSVETLPIDQVVRSLEDSDSLLVLMENKPQTGLLLPENWNAEGYPGRIAKGVWLNFSCQHSVGALGYEGTEETENILYRAVVDRGIQVLWIAPIYTTAGTLITEPSVYAGLLSGLEGRIKNCGYSYGLPLGYPAQAPSVWLLYLTGMAILLGCLLFVSRLFPLRPWLLWTLLGLCIAENTLGFLLRAQLQIHALALACAICFPCLAVVLLWPHLERKGKGRPSLRRLSRGLLLSLGTALLGGLLIAALQSSREFLTVMRLFRGVKLSQAAAYSFSLLYFAWMYFRSAGFRRGAIRRVLFSRRGILIGVALILLAVGIGAVYLLRTGDRMLTVPVAEQRMRNWLEHTLLYRPRSKEFLFAWPLLGLACYFARRGRRGLSALCGSGVGTGFASVVNTFCHSRAHVLVSLGRTGIGLLAGIGIALILIAVLSLFRAITKRKASP